MNNKYRVKLWFSYSHTVIIDAESQEKAEEYAHEFITDDNRNWDDEWIDSSVEQL